MILKNALVYTPRHTFEKGDLVIRDGRIAAYAQPQEGEEVVDADGCTPCLVWWICTSTVQWATTSAMQTKPACRPLQTLKPPTACWPSAPLP